MHPKAFVSYSWTSPEHEKWVLDLATELAENGVDVILDKWALREGQDKYQFMERMVTDPDVTKVIAVCDAQYAQKAVCRAGGVGTESQIISKEVYEKVDQTKFVAVVTERDERSQPFLPTFFGPRIYIDMSTETTRRENFEQLLRWIYDKPLHEKPPLGRPPSFLLNDSATNLGTTSRLHRALDAVKLEKATASGAVQDYLETFATNFGRFSAIIGSTDRAGDALLRALPSSVIFRDEYVDLLLAVTRYRDDDGPYEALGDFFEQLLPYLVAETTGETRDLHKVLVYELFLYTAAALIKSKKLSRLRHLLDREFYVAADNRRYSRTRTFETFQVYPESLIARKTQLRIPRFSLIGDLLTQRASRQDISLPDLEQADFMLFVYSVVRTNPFDRWDPHVAIFAPQSRPLPIFDRASSTRYFAELATFFEVADRDDLVNRFSNALPAQWLNYWEALQPFDLINSEYLSTRP